MSILAAALMTTLTPNFGEWQLLKGGAAVCRAIAPSLAAPRGNRVGAPHRFSGDLRELQYTDAAPPTVSRNTLLAILGTDRVDFLRLAPARAAQVNLPSPRVAGVAGPSYRATAFALRWRTRSYPVILFSVGGTFAFVHNLLPYQEVRLVLFRGQPYALEHGERLTVERLEWYPNQPDGRSRILATPVCTFSQSH